MYRHVYYFLYLVSRSMYRKAPTTMSLMEYSKAINASVSIHLNPRAEVLVALQMPPKILSRRQSVPTIVIGINGSPTNAPPVIEPQNQLLPLRQRRMSTSDLSSANVNPSFDRSDILRALNMPQLMDLDSDSKNNPLEYQYQIILGKEL